ncbi:hypothetical protein ACFX2I_041510 [Malus domestica]
MEARQDSSDARFEKLYHDFVDKCDMGSHPPFIKMASPISFEKSNQVVLKLQSFHVEKIHAKESVNQFSQFHQSYKPKTHPCLRPILKIFKKVRDYGKHDDNGSAIFRSNSKFEESCGFFRKALVVEDEKVFNLFDRETKDSVKIPPLLDSNHKAGTAKELVSLFNKKVEDYIVASPVLDSDCRKSKVQVCVLGSTFRNGLATSFGHKFIQFGTTPSSIRESSCKNDVVQDFIFTIPVSDYGFVKIDSPTPQVFDERSHSIDCDFQLGYHMSISDTRGKVETILVQDDASTGVVLILQFRYHKGIRDKGGGLAKNKIWKDHSRIFRNKISTILISSCTKESENATAYNKDGTVCLSEFNSMDFLAICELGFVLNAKKRNFLEEADPFIVPAEKTRPALNVFDEIPDSNCCVVVNYDMCYCKGIRNKGGGSKFKYMVTLNIHFSCMNASRDSIECSQDGIFEVEGGEFYSSNIQLRGAGKKKFPNVRDDYLVHSFYGQKKLTFERNVHGSFGLPDTSHLLEGGILIGRRMMTMSDHGILYHLSSKYDKHMKLDAAFTGAMHMPKLENGSSVLGLLLLTLWRTNLI